MRIFLEGQSTLEYVIIFAALVGAIIAVSVVFKSHLSGSYNSLKGNISQLVEGG